MGWPERDIAQAKSFIAPPGYSRHRPETTLLYQLVAEHYPRFRDRRAAEGRALPQYVEDEFEAYLKCGLLQHGFLRVKCESCQAEKLVAFSCCKRRGFCPSCGARRMAETAALLVDDVLPRQPVRQWVLSLPFALRYLLATRPEVVTQVLGIVYRAISAHRMRKAGLTRASAVTRAVTLIQRFGSALNLNVHLHMLVLDGVYRREGEGGLRAAGRFDHVPDRDRPEGGPQGVHAADAPGKCGRNRAGRWPKRVTHVPALGQRQIGHRPATEPDLGTTARARVRHRHRGLPALRRAAAGDREHRGAEAPALIERILEHLGRDAESVDPAHPSRAPPRGDLSL